MATVASLHVYPVKSCRGITLEQARLTPAGLEHDREWMIVTPAGRFITQRDLPRMALIGTALTADALVLDAPGMTTLPVPFAWQPEVAREVVVWKDRVAAFDMGEVAASWVSEFLARPLRLVRFDSAHRRLANLDRTGGVEAPTRFPDAYPVLIISRASLADLNSRLEEPVPMNRFRPNVVLDGVGPYAEDAAHEFVGNGVNLRMVKPCIRCIITTTDQDTGEQRGAEPLRTLKTYRFDRALKGVLFGHNAIVIEGDSLRTGQVLTLRMR
ncbi:MAG: MOSC N-terminal beta barrel domain-containing protein [Steroidobacteraceae bacterium]